MRNEMLIPLTILLCLAGTCACERTVDLGGGPDGSEDAIGEPAEDTHGGDPLDDSGPFPDAVTDGVGDTTSDAHTDTSTDAVPDLPTDGPEDPGWRDSTEPICPGVEPAGGMFAGLDVWSDDRGVWFYLEVGDTFEPGTRTRSIWHNDGTGWSTLVDGPAGDVGIPDGNEARMTGIPGGDLFLYGGEYVFDVDSGTGDTTHESVWLEDMFVVDADLVYGVLVDDPKIVWNTGSGWGPYPGDPLPYELLAIWGQESFIVSVGANGVAVLNDGTGWELSDTGTLGTMRSVWGFSESDVWAGGEGGLLMHWDGSDWQEMDWPDLGDDADMCRPSRDAIVGMWGTDGELFFHTRNQIVTWDGSAFRSLGYWAGVERDSGEGWSYCDGGFEIGRIWGNSPEEVFVTVGDTEGGEHECAQYLMWWDGAAFHWF